MNAMPSETALRRVVRIVALLNLGYFGVEFAVALTIGSVALFADSIDFLEDASVNFLIFAALGWSAIRRAHVGMILAGILDGSTRGTPSREGISPRLVKWRAATTSSTFLITIRNPHTDIVAAISTPPACVSP